MSGKRKRKPEGVPLSPEMQAVIQEALGMAGWDAAEVAELLASGALDDPMLQASLEGELSEAFEFAMAHEIVRVGYFESGGRRGAAGRSVTGRSKSGKRPYS